MEVLHQCFPPRVRRTLRELPESLDGTYERILKEIKKPNKDIARRVLQCLVVASRPLCVAELAEVLAVDFEDTEGIPRLNPDWWWEDQEQAILIACSSLIAIVEPGDDEPSNSDWEAETDDSDWEAKTDDCDTEAKTGDSSSEVGFDDGNSEAETDDGDSDVEAGDSRVVQFSHFSVKEFLTSSRHCKWRSLKLPYRIGACSYDQIQDNINRHTLKDHPARYAAEH